MGTRAMWQWLLILSGVAQLVLIVGSLAIPRVLGWKQQLASLPTLTRQMFWVYAGYIWGTNLCFGLISAFGSHWLLQPTPLAAAVCGFIFVYWGARMVVQFTYFDLSEMPKGFWHTVAKWCLELLFLGLTAIYGAILYMHLRGHIPQP